MGVTGIFAFLLGLFLIFAPTSYLSLYVIDYALHMTFATQRLGPAVAGFGAVLWTARGWPAGPMAASLCLIGAFVWAGVAATGAFHYATGVANFNIVIAAVIEVILALLFLIASRQIRSV